MKKILLVKQRIEKHTIIINNTSNHIERLKINFEKESLKNFLLSTRFLFQNLERVQFYDLNGNLLGDSNVLDLDQTVFSKPETIFQENIGKDIKSEKNKLKDGKSFQETEGQNIKNIVNKKGDSPFVIELKEGNNFYIKTLELALLILYPC